MATIVDIARKVGVSHQVVSKVLHGGKSRTGASEVTREKVMKVARELGYRPHMASKALRQQAFHSVGVIMGDTHSFYLPQEALTTVSHRLSEIHYSCSMVCVKGFDAESILETPPIKMKMVDAILIAYVRTVPAKILKSLQALETPFIWLMRPTPFDSAYVDEADASALLVRHLVTLGHKKITLLDYDYTVDRTAPPERIRGFESEIRKSGIKGEKILQSFPYEKQSAIARCWLEKKNKSSAVIVNSITTAQILMQSAVRLNIRIPQDLSIASFDETRNYLANVPNITCATRSNTDLGHAAAELILEKIKHPKIKLPSRCLKYRLTVGGSTVSPV